MKRAIFLVTMLMQLVLQSNGQNFHNFYDDASLNYWQGRYANNVQAQFNEELLGFLPPGCQVNLTVPRLPDGPINAFNFYAQGNTVVIPASAILFLDQIITAFVWLDLNGYSTEAVVDYMGMLKLQSFSIYPLPWPTLGIPPNPYTDPRVEALTQEYLKTALLWIIAHEVGHVCYQHTRSTIFNEEQADNFANEMFREMGYPPKGIVLFFVAMTNFLPHRGDFVNDNEWYNYYSSHKSHPYTADRITKLGQALRYRPADFIRNVINPAPDAQQLVTLSWIFDRLAGKLKDSDIQDMMTVRALAANPSYLRPRTTDNVTWVPKSIGTNYSSFSGTYEGVYKHFVSSGATEYLDLNLSLKRNNQLVTGTFNFGVGVGSLKGFVDLNNRLIFEWTWGNAAGNGVLTKSGSTYFNLEGTWGLNASSTDIGTWKIVKVR